MQRWGRRGPNEGEPAVPLYRLACAVVAQQLADGTPALIHPIEVSAMGSPSQDDRQAENNPDNEPCHAFHPNI
jgi:hypothetical protein